jgi:hypothetical protein
MRFAGGAVFLWQRSAHADTGRAMRADLSWRSIRRASSGPTDIPVMQTAEPRERDHLPHLGSFHGPLCRSVAGQAHVRAVVVYPSGLARG